MKHDLRWVQHFSFPIVGDAGRVEPHLIAWCVCGWRTEALVGDGSDEDRNELERRFLDHLPESPGSPAGVTAMGPRVCSIQSEQCDDPAEWRIVAPDETVLLSCDRHLTWLLYGDGTNTVTEISAFST